MNLLKTGETYQFEQMILPTTALVLLFIKKTQFGFIHKNKKHSDVYACF